MQKKYRKFQATFYQVSPNDNITQNHHTLPKPGNWQCCNTYSDFTILLIQCVYLVPENMLSHGQVSGTITTIDTELFFHHKETLLSYFLIIPNPPPILAHYNNKCIFHNSIPIHFWINYSTIVQNITLQDCLLVLVPLASV